MSPKKIVSTVILASFVAITVVCVALCKEPRPGQLHFMNNSRKFITKAKSLVVVTHGWIEKGEDDWPEDMAVAIQKKVDPNSWRCGYFDWSAGAKTLNATTAVKYARNTAGPKLAEDILAEYPDLKHIHLIAHSSGCWVISEAAIIIAERSDCDIHLTFIEAYVPKSMAEAELGDVNMADPAKFWADHYYTRDYTLSWTQHDLTHAHNVDITKIDPWIKDHNFPWKWYLATINGKYPEKKFLDSRKLITTCGQTEYGFTRAKEASDPNGWNESLKLLPGNKGIKFGKPAH